MADVFWINTASASASWTATANWSGGAVPVNGDNVYLLNSPSQIDTGLNQSAVRLAGLFILSTFTGSLGVLGLAGASLQIGFDKARIGDPNSDGTTAAGSGRIKLDSGNTGANTTELTLVGTASKGSDTGIEPVRWLASGTNNILNALNGLMGIATTPGQTARVDQINLLGSGAKINTGAGVTLTTANVRDGALAINSALTTLNQSGGNVKTQTIGIGGYNVATANISGGTFQVNHINDATGTARAITALNLTGKGTADLEGDSRTKRIGTVVRRDDSNIKLNNGNPGSISIATLTN
jgi:hypothetical protein